MTATTLTVPSAAAWPKRVLLAAGIFAACWGGALWYWQQALRAPATTELAVVLLALPLGLILLLWSGKKWAFKRPAALPASTATSAPHAAAGIPPGPALAILATALRTPHGNSAEELASAIASQQARPDLDVELLDDSGFPVFSARSVAAIDAVLKDELLRWLHEQQLSELDFKPAQWRALILATAVVIELAVQAVVSLLPTPVAENAHLKPPQLRLLPLLPAGWTLEQRSAASRWFKHSIAAVGWPIDQITWIDCAPEQGPAQLLQQFASDSAAPQARLVALMLACDSHLDQETVDAWASSGTLYTPTAQQGRVPGEGAAGLLLSDTAQAQALADAPCALCEPVAAGRRESAIDATKRVDAKLLGALTERCAHVAQIALSEVSMLVADTGQRTNRVFELMGLASNLLPQLDNAADVACVGVATGHCGSVPAVSALALASHLALQRAAPVLCVGNDDAQMRWVSVVRPPPPMA